MPTTITINNISGATPYDVYVCSNPSSTCIYIDTITLIPYSFDVPSLIDGQPSYILKVIDDNDCIITETLTP
jgi:hypothetical protein|tara:strand:- start:2765 stop:2980 length:216 start_codon:yes stop_codon:yes gene_type:complete